MEPAQIRVGDMITTTIGRQFVVGEIIVRSGEAYILPEGGDDYTNTSLVFWNGSPYLFKFLFSFYYPTSKYPRYLFYSFVHLGHDTWLCQSFNDTKAK